MTDYATLVADVGDWLARDDLAARIPTFIRLVEAKINRDLRIRALEQTAQLVLDANQEAVLPADFQKMITCLAGDCPLEYVSRLTKSNSLSDTQYSTLNFTFLGPPNVEDIDIWYYARLPALNDTTQTTNWVSINAYDVYLNGCLMVAQPYLLEDERTELFATLYTDALDQLNKADKKDKLGEARLTPKPPFRGTP